MVRSCVDQSEIPYADKVVLINNAIEVDLSMAVEPAARRNTLNSNFNNAVSSHILVTQVFVPLLRKSRHPRVVMVPSTRWSFGKTVAGEVCCMLPLFRLPGTASELTRSSYHQSSRPIIAC